MILEKQHFDADTKLQECLKDIVNDLIKIKSDRLVSCEHYDISEDTYEVHDTCYKVFYDGQFKSKDTDEIGYIHTSVDIYPTEILAYLLF